MKNIILIFCLLFSFNLIAQQDSTSCSTIVLGNYKEIPALIDSISTSHLYYRKCPDSTNRQFTIPLNYVKFINDPKEIINPNTLQLTGSSLKAPGVKKVKVYDTWVYLNKEPFKIQGVIYELKDSSILISQTVKSKNYLFGDFKPIEFYTKDIKVIKTRRKNNKKRGALIGAIAGFVVGVPLSYSIWKSFGFEEDTSLQAAALLYGCLFAGAGAGIGIGIGSIKVSIPLNGSLNKSNYKKLKKYAIKQ